MEPQTAAPCGHLCWSLCQGLLLSRHSRAAKEKMQRWKGQTKGWGAGSEDVQPMLCSACSATVPSPVLGALPRFALGSFSFLARRMSFPFKFPELSPPLCTSVTCPLFLTLLPCWTPDPWSALLWTFCEIPLAKKQGREPPWEPEMGRERINDRISHCGHRYGWKVYDHKDKKTWKNKVWHWIMGISCSWGNSLPLGELLQCLLGGDRKWTKNCNVIWIKKRKKLKLFHYTEMQWELGVIAECRNIFMQLLGGKKQNSIIVLDVFSMLQHVPAEQRWV